jgi:[ribosomal protein S5]-alanine N-acetyltransferase
LIRRLVPDDAPEVARLLVANRAFLAPYEPEHAEDFFTPEVQRARIEKAEHLYAILDREALAGVISLSNVVRGPLQSASLGYWVDEPRNGLGLATRAVASLAELAFGELGLHRLEAGVLVDNVASRHVLEKNGFTLIGAAPRYLRIAGAWRDHHLFQRTAEE